MTVALEQALAGLGATDLAEIEACAALQTRVDRKHVLEWESFAELVRRLAPGHRTLEIDGRRTFSYESVYFDSADLASFRDHTRSRRKRFKCRVRRYVETGLCVFEVKLKGGRGETIKRRIPYSQEDHGAMTPAAEEFLRHTLEREYGQARHEPLRPALRVTYTRATLASPAEGERMTCDTRLRVARAGAPVVAMRPDLVIVETKTAHGRGVADAELRSLGVRPVRFSKYCVGLAVLDPELPAAPWRRHARLHFTGTPATGVR